MKIYLLTRNQNLYSSRRILESARYRGHDITPIDYMNCDLVLEQGESKIIYQGEELEIPDVIIPRIGANYTNYGASVIRQFTLLGATTTVTSDALMNSRNKFLCLQLLSRNGVKMPKTGFSSTSASSKKLIEYVGGVPVVVKLLEGTHGLGVLLLDSESSAESVLDAFSELGARVMVQQFIKESSGMDIRAIVAGGKVVASMKRTAQEGEFRSNIHRGGVGEMIQLTPEQEATAIKSAEVVGLGIAGVDMLVSDNGAMVIEVNSSPGIEGIETYTQLDVAQEFIKYLEEKLSKA
jgi:ribosomal protein S6--L-glutamate ligase